MLVQLIYISRPIEEFRQIVCDSGETNAERNKAKNINGILLIHDNFYLQLLEGNRSDINDLYSKLIKDKKHTDVTLLRYQDVKLSEFSNWNLAVMDSKHCEFENCNDIIAGSVNLRDNDIVSYITGMTAISILRRAYTVMTVFNAPNRRKTDLEHIHVRRSDNK